MTDEQMLTEGREAGKKYVSEFHGDWKALAADLNRRTLEEGRPLFTVPPVPAVPNDELARPIRPVPI